jgi:hypothetical protein
MSWLIGNAPSNNRYVGGAQLESADHAAKFFFGGRETAVGGIGQIPAGRLRRWGVRKVLLVRVVHEMDK